mmetsp:Transcript_24221/g.69838  ORF Transcript_24221/g.69838 Transcript_24221/m.69838 type:complete len:282 (+) Transcript_24221:398-1243(+)
MDARTRLRHDHRRPLLDVCTEGAVRRPFISVSRRQGHDTVMDLEARKSREVAGGLVALKSQAGNWTRVIEGICRQVEEEMSGPTSRVQADWYKMLLYSEGDFFEVHKDTQRSNDHFASLLVFLPTEYTGGDFLLHDDGEFDGERFNRETQDALGHQQARWIAFYSRHCPQRQACSVGISPRARLQLAPSRDRGEVQEGRPVGAPIAAAGGWHEGALQLSPGQRVVGVSAIARVHSLEYDASSPQRHRQRPLPAAFSAFRLRHPSIVRVPVVRRRPQNQPRR